MQTRPPRGFTRHIISRGARSFSLSRFHNLFTFQKGGRLPPPLRVYIACFYIASSPRHCLSHTYRYWGYTIQDLCSTLHKSLFSPISWFLRTLSIRNKRMINGLFGIRKYYIIWGAWKRKFLTIASSYRDWRCLKLESRISQIVIPKRCFTSLIVGFINHCPKMFPY